MNQSRRDLMKFFGIGTVIMPVIGGVVETSAPAKLIEAPKIDLIVSPAMSDKTLDVSRSSMKSLTVHIEFHDGTTRSIRSVYSPWGSGAISPADRLHLNIRVEKIEGGSPQTYTEVAVINASGALL